MSPDREMENPPGPYEAVECLMPRLYRGLFATLLAELAPPEYIIPPGAVAIVAGHGWPDRLRRLIEAGAGWRVPRTVTFLHPTPSSVRTALQLGVRVILDEEQPPARLRDAIRFAVNAQPFYSEPVRAIASRLRLTGAEERATPPLTPRERLVADLASRGYTNVQIAYETGLGVETVRSHLSHVYGKLGVRGRNDLPFELDRRQSPPPPDLDEVERLREPGSLLTPAEWRVAVLVARGCSNREVATALEVGLSTAKRHLKSVFHKVGVHRRSELVTLIERREPG